MKPRHQVSPAAIELIKRFEGYRRKAARLPDGRWTLGHGHTLTAREGAEVSKEDAEALLLYDLIGVSHAVNELTWAPLNRNQFDALCAFVFNIGVENYRTSMVLKRLNQGAVLQAAACMELWRTAEVNGERMVVDALVRRRAAEKLLFLTPTEGWVAAPTPLLPPRLDCEAVDEYALQSPPPFPNPGVEPEEPEPEAAPGERAASALGARLEQIFPQAEETAPSLRLTPAPQVDEPEPLAEAENPVPERSVLEKVSAPARSPGWLTTAAPVLLAVVGMALAGAALFWGAYATSVGGLDARWVSWVGGPSGVLLAGFGAYLALRRLGETDRA